MLWKLVNAVAKQELLKRAVPQTMRLRIRGKLQDWKWRWYRAQPKPRLDPEIRRELIDYYRDDILKLQDLIGRDLSHWLIADNNTDESNQILDLVMSIEGQITRDEARKLIELAQKVDEEAVIVEIGSYRGRSTVALALGARLGNGNRVYSIDPHEEFEGVCGGKFGPQDQAHLYRNITRADVGDLVSVISLPSTHAARAWSKCNVGLLWIDGDHRYEAVKADYEAWKRYLIPRSIVAFHDVNTPGVRRLTTELVESGELRKLGRIDQLAWYQYGG